VLVSTRWSWPYRGWSVKFHAATVGWCWYRMVRALEGSLSGRIWDGILTWHGLVVTNFSKIRSAFIFKDKQSKKNWLFFFLDCLTLKINEWRHFETFKTARTSATFFCQQHLCENIKSCIPAFVWKEWGSNENNAHDSRELTRGPSDYESGMPPNDTAYICRSFVRNSGSHLPDYTALC
jgi:hypothetical protein